MNKLETEKRMREKAREHLKGKWTQVVLLIFVTTLIMSTIINAVYTLVILNSFENGNYDTLNYQYLQIFMLLVGNIILASGYKSVIMDIKRNPDEHINVWERFFETYKSDRLFLLVGIDFAVWIKTCLWSLLLIVPGIYKGYAFTQSYFLAKDTLYAGDKKTINELTAESEKMMYGYKWNLFVLMFTFFGWLLISFIVNRVSSAIAVDIINNLPIDQFLSFNTFIMVLIITQVSLLLVTLVQATLTSYIAMTNVVFYDDLKEVLHNKLNPTTDVIMDGEIELETT